MNKEKQFDCVKFKLELHKNLVAKSKAKNIREYVAYVNKISQEASLHKVKERNV
jgi:acyl-CoA-binding protein